MILVALFLAALPHVAAAIVGRRLALPGTKLSMGFIIAGATWRRLTPRRRATTFLVPLALDVLFIHALAFAAGWVEQTTVGAGEIDPVPGGRAHEAGLRAGDRVVAVDGEPVADLAAARTRLADTREGEQAALTVRRDGQELHIDVTPRYGVFGLRPAMRDRTVTEALVFALTHPSTTVAAWVTPAPPDPARRPGPVVMVEVLEDVPERSVAAKLVGGASFLTLPMSLAVLVLLIAGTPWRASRRAG